MEEPSLVDDLLGNPWLPYGAGGLIALLGGFAFWRTRQRKKNQSNMDSSFLESRLQPDSFFGASGGQRVDTNNENSVTGSSMVYSASQLDAADDVVRHVVVDIVGQLDEAKRRAQPAAFRLTGSHSPDWTRICEMGMGFDPSNPLYQPGGAPAGDSGSTQPITPVGNSSFGGNTIPQPVRADMGDSVPGVDLDLDLDFSLDDEPAPAVSELNSSVFNQDQAEQTIKMPVMAGDDANAPMDMNMDFEMPNEEPVPAQAQNPEPLYEAPSALPEISLSMDLDEPSIDHHPVPEFNVTVPAPVASAAPVADAMDSGMLEFDLGSLSLDLEGPASEQPTASDDLGEDGARALIEEVVAEATGEMRAKAQRALANLS